MLQLCSVGTQGPQPRAGGRTEASPTARPCPSPAWPRWCWWARHGGSASPTAPGAGPSPAASVRGPLGGHCRVWGLPPLSVPTPWSLEVTWEQRMGSLWDGSWEQGSCADPRRVFPVFPLRDEVPLLASCCSRQGFEEQGDPRGFPCHRVFLQSQILLCSRGAAGSLCLEGSELSPKSLSLFLTDPSLTTCADPGVPLFGMQNNSQGYQVWLWKRGAPQSQPCSVLGLDSCVIPWIPVFSHGFVFPLIDYCLLHTWINVSFHGLMFPPMDSCVLL